MTRTSSEIVERVLLGLGSNLGDRLATLREARRRIAGDGAILVIAASSVFETAPQGGPPQGAYLNACLAIATSRAPHALLDVLHEIERAAGRVRGERNAPRTLDLDMLLFGERVVSDERLEVPHPRLDTRAFALVPAAEVAAMWRVPPRGASIQDLAALAGADGVRLFCREEEWR